MLRFGFDNSYVRDLPGFYVPWKPVPVAAPGLLFFNRALAQELALEPGVLEGPEGLAIFSGNALPADAEPIAQAYAGHQFGGFSPQLGDGRALLIGELVDRHGQRRDIAFKGSGPTPFSRNGDGKAAVGPMLREVLLGEAMHALGIPTTRALAVVATGEAVLRDRPLPGAVLTRVAASHLRVGTFEFFAAREDLDRLRQLGHYAIARHDPDLVGAPDRFLGLLRVVARRQALLVARWMGVGFIHGVMNTDNMTISGETIDYGPCAFLEAYNPETVFSSIDHDGRYAYGRQAPIARWNIARFAEALLPLIADGGDEAAMERAVAQAREVIDAFPAWHEEAMLQLWRDKLGLYAGSAAELASDAQLAKDWLAQLQTQAVDFTLAWRHLADAAEGNDGALRALFPDPRALEGWLARWRARCARDELQGGPAGIGRAARMRGVNPWVIPRNHRIEEALAAASDDGDLAPFERLLSALRQPFEANPAQALYAEPAPASVTASYRTYCGT